MNENDIPFVPEQASTFAGQIDFIYWTLTLMSLVFAVAIPFIILFFIVKYHRSMKANRKNPVNSSMPLEITWSIIPLVLGLGVFFWNAFVYFDMHRVPERTLDVYVIGKQWMWHIQHPNGKRENNELHVPLGQPVRLIMTSQDVIHSFYVPAFRLKHDVLPGRYTTMWFEPTKVGEYHLFCAEYCGTEHARMIGRVVVLPLADYQRWLETPGEVILPSGNDEAAMVATGGDQPMSTAGAALFTSKGCVSCHGGQNRVGPPMEGLYNSEVLLTDGSSVLADENYLRTSILNPQSEIVAGYAPIMPTYEGQLSEDELTQLLEYIKSLADN